MESPIFSALPTIHIALLSIMVALYSVFAIYAYQKINEYSQAIDHLISDSKDLIIDIPRVSVGLEPPFENDGSINWKQSCELVLQDIRFEFYDIEKPNFFPSDEKTIELGDKLAMLLIHMFSAYPFYSKSYFQYSNHTITVDKHKEESPLTNERISDMHYRLQSLNNFHAMNSKRLEIFLSKYLEAITKRARGDNQKHLQKIQSEYNIEDNFESVRAHYERALGRKLQILKMIPTQLTKGFEISESYFNNTLVPLRKAFDGYELFSKTYQVKRWGITVIRYTVFSIILGVLMPLILLKFQSAHPDLGMGATIFGSLELFLLGLTISPYLYLMLCLYKKLKSLKFK